MVVQNCVWYACGRVTRRGVRSMDNYKKLIIEMVEKIHDEKFLKRIYISLREFLKEEKPE